MKNQIHLTTIVIALAVMMTTQSYGQFPPQDKWYQNPLGFEPLNLHTSMGFIVPAIVTGTALLVTRKNGDLRNRLTMYSDIGMTFGYKYPFTNMLQSSTGIDIMMRKWLSVGSEFSIIVPFDSYNTATGFSLRPFARFYLVNGQHCKLWFESGGGLICFTNTFPKPTTEDQRNGTAFNGITKYGIGTSFHITHQLQITAGARHLHISNGNRKGVERNPSHDSNGLFVGLSWNIKQQRNESCQ